MDNEAHTNPQWEALREALEAFVEQAHRPSEPTSVEPGNVNDVLGPAAQWYGENVLGPAAQWSKENVLGPAAQWYGENVLGPAAQWSKENVLGPTSQWWTQQSPELPELPEFPDLPEPPFSVWDLPRSAEDEFQPRTGIEGWEDVLRRVRRELDKIGPRLEPLTDSPPIPTPDDEPGEDDQDEDQDEGWGWDWLDFLAIVWAAVKLYELIDSEPALLSKKVKWASDWDGKQWADEGGLEIVHSVESTTKLFWSLPMAARVGDMMAHGNFAVPGPGSTTVYFGSKPALLPTDQAGCAVALPAPHAPAGFVTTNAKVFINGQPALRAGDFQNEGPGGPNPIVLGCKSVWVGDPAPAVHVTRYLAVHTVVRTDPSPWKLTIRPKASIDGKFSLGVAWFGPYIGFEGAIDFTLGFELSYEPEFLEVFGKKLSVSTDLELVKFEGLARVYTSWRDLVALRPIPRAYKIESSKPKLTPGKPKGRQSKDTK